MFLKLLVIALLFYYVARTGKNLYRAIAHDPRAQGQVPPSHERQQQARSSRPQPPQWQGPPTTQSRHEPDVEEAKWVDL
ncbi:MAG TPA: hypothetical protein VKP65_17795 [Rhodothermales bacterium]|nr:hypothetical protein [Rhodothermales bacterium]